MLLLLGLSAAALGAEPVAQVKVRGSSVRFPTAIAQSQQGKPVRLVLTGTALRTKFGLSVYAIASYVQEGVAIDNAEALADADVPKVLHLVFEREVDGATVARSFCDSIGLNHPAPAFQAELARLTEFFEPEAIKRGDEVWLTFVPRIGLVCHVTGRPPVRIESVPFAHAAWETYLGRKNLGVAIQTGLTSRL
jgi:hypothetical protein